MNRTAENSGDSNHLCFWIIGSIFVSFLIQKNNSKAKAPLSRRVQSSCIASCLGFLGRVATVSRLGVVVSRRLNFLLNFPRDETTVATPPRQKVRHDD